MEKRKIVYRKKHNLELYDMDKIIECARCKRKVTVGECYTSQYIFTKNGFWGLNVCPICHEQEMYDKEKER